MQVPSSALLEASCTLGDVPGNAAFDSAADPPGQQNDNDKNDTQSAEHNSQKSHHGRVLFLARRTLRAGTKRGVVPLRAACTSRRAL